MIRVRKTELKRHSLTTVRFPAMRIRSKFPSKLLPKLLLASSWDFLAKGFWSNCFKVFASFFPSPLQLKTFVSSFPSISAPPTTDQGAVLWDFLGGEQKEASGCCQSCQSCQSCQMHIFTVFNPCRFPHPPRALLRSAQILKSCSQSQRKSKAGIALSRSSHLALHNLHFSVNWHSALYSPSSAP